MSTVRGPQPNPALEQTWRDRVERWKVSGLNVRDFCRREGLAEPSFYSWRRTLAGRDVAATPPTPAFVPVHVLPGTPPPPLELVLRSGHVLRVPRGCDPDHLRSVVAALEGTSC